MTSQKSLHPATDELYRALYEAKVVNLPVDQCRELISNHLYAADEILTEMGEQYFIAHPGAEGVPYSVIVFKVEDKFQFRAYVGNADIIDGRKAGLAEVMHGELRKNVVSSS
jgi:hypothetical protein